MGEHPKARPILIRPSEPDWGCEAWAARQVLSVLGLLYAIAPPGSGSHAPAKDPCNAMG